MVGKKYTLTNTGTTFAFFSYQKFESPLWEYQNSLNPGQTKTFWAMENTLTIPNYYTNTIDVESESFSTESSSSCTDCNGIMTPCVGQSVVSNGITISCTGTQSFCSTTNWEYSTPCTPFMQIIKGPAIGQGSLAGGTDSITFTFSQPINNLRFRFAPLDRYPNTLQPGAFITDVLIVTTNVGPPQANSTLIQCAGCNQFTLVNNTIGGYSELNGGTFSISMPVPYTSVTFSMLKTPANGVRINLCAPQSSIPPTPSVTPTVTKTPAASPTNTPTTTPTKTPIPSVTPTNTVTPTKTTTNTPTPSNTPTNTPTNTITPTNTGTPAETPLETPTNTPTPTVTSSPTLTPSPSATSGATSCVGYVLDSGFGSASIEWFDCGGSYFTQTFTGQYTICTDGSGYVVTIGSVTVVSGPYSC